MEGPGMSLFQGAGSIHINNSAQDRLQEQEEIEDQKRRNEELKHKLVNAFDDLLDDDEASSVNSSGNFTLDHAQTQTNGGHVNMNSHTNTNSKNSYDTRQEYMNNEQLKVMYEMRVKECQQLAAQMETMEGEIESLRARLATTANSRDKAELSLQEAHHLLASSKHQLLELEQQVTGVTEKLIASEEEKEQLKMEVLSSNISLQEVQQRLHTLQVAHSHDTDNLFREQQNRHREEVDRLQNDLIKAKHRLEDKENEIKRLEKHCVERDREKELLLVEKGTTINRLASELKTAQDQLMAAEKARSNDKSKLEATMHELTQCQYKMAATQKEFDKWRSTLQQVFIEAMPEANTGEPLSPGKLASLKEVLIRQKQQLKTLAALKEDIAKRDEKLEWYKKKEEELRATLEEHKSKEMQLNSRIAVLQNKIKLLGSSSDGDVIEMYKERNEKLQAELDEARNQLKSLGLQYAELELALERTKTERSSQAYIAQEANTDMIRELEKYSTQLKNTLRENGELKNLYLQACSTRDAATRELKEIQASIDNQRDQYKTLEKEYIERIERQNENVTKLTTELTTCREELETAYKRISELQREFTDKQKLFTDKLDKYLKDERNGMRNETSNCTHCDKLMKQIPCLEEQISQCTLKLAAQQSNEQLMAELKDKAEFFQQYIMERYRKLKELRTVGTNTEDAPITPPDRGAPEGSGETDELAAKTSLMLQEKAIRDHIADKYTLEIKTMEMNCSRRVKEMELKHYQTVMTLKELVESKAQQVDTLKDKLLSERAEAAQMLDAKEKEISVLIKEHNEIQKQCRRYKEEVTKLTLKIDNRAKSMAELKKEVDEWKEKVKLAASEDKGIKKKYTELKSLFRETEQKYNQIQGELEKVIEKYNACKKTVLTYKDYIGKKDRHISNEMRRIQDEYREMFVKLQTQLNHLISSRTHELKMRGCSNPDQQLPKYDYSEKIEKLGEEFAKITQFREPDSDQ